MLFLGSFNRLNCHGSLFFCRNGWLWLRRPSSPVLKMKDYRARDIFIKTGLNCETMVVWCTKSSSWWAEVTENAPHSLIHFTAFIYDYSDGISICGDLFRVLLPLLWCNGNVLARTSSLRLSFVTSLSWKGLFAFIKPLVRPHSKDKLL